MSSALHCIALQPLEAAEGVGTIVHAEVSNMVYPVTLDTMYQVFSKFGAIVRIVTFVKNDKFQCLAQFHDNMAASSARMVCACHRTPSPLACVTLRTTPWGVGASMARHSTCPVCTCMYRLHRAWSCAQMRRHFI
jgi:hypothetical protein